MIVLQASGGETNITEKIGQALHLTLSAGDYLVITVIVALASLLAKTLIEESIKAQYAFGAKAKEQSSKIAEFLSHLYSDQPDTRLLNQLAWELTLWLPDDILSDLASACVRGTKDPAEVLVAVRKKLYPKTKLADTTNVMKYQRKTADAGDRPDVLKER